MITRYCDEIVEYEGKSIKLEKMKDKYCPECGEEEWVEESYQRYEEARSLLGIPEGVNWPA